MPPSSDSTSPTCGAVDALVAARPARTPSPTWPRRVRSRCATGPGPRLRRQRGWDAVGPVGGRPPRRERRCSSRARPRSMASRHPRTCRCAKRRRSGRPSRTGCPRSAAEQVALEAGSGHAGRRRPRVQPHRARPATRIRGAGPGERGSRCGRAGETASSRPATSTSGAISATCATWCARTGSSSRRWRAATVPGGHRLYNVASGRAVAIREIVDALAAIAGIEVAVEVDPALVRQDDPPEIRGDASLIAADLGWIPRSRSTSRCATSWTTSFQCEPIYDLVRRSGRAVSAARS